MAPLDSYDGFAAALGKDQRIRDVRQVGTTLSLLTRIAGDQSKIMEGRDDTWVKLESLFGDAIPASVAAVLREAMTKALSEDESSEAHPWQALEAWAANYLAAA